MSIQTKFSSNKFIINLWIVLLLVACAPITPAQLGWNQDIPNNSELVYQIGPIRERKLGFINTDGSNTQILQLETYLARPVWSADGTFIYGLANGSPAISLGFPAYWDSDGNFQECRNWERYSQIEAAGNPANLKEVLISNVRTIWLVDLDRCEEIKVLVDYEQQKNLGVTKIMGFSYSPDSHELIYSLEINNDLLTNSEYPIIKLNLETGLEVQLAEGISPAWSPDGTQIAFVKADGIYLMQSDGSQQRLLLQRIFVDPRTNFLPFQDDPNPHWSPDGAWLVYQIRETEDTPFLDSTIYIKNIATGEERRVISGGVYPRWKP